VVDGVQLQTQNRSRRRMKPLRGARHRFDPFTAPDGAAPRACFKPVHHPCQVKQS